MAYANACFISYKRPPQWGNNFPGPAPARQLRHLWLEFAETFQDRLNQVLSTSIPSYRDSAIDPGQPYPQVLSKNLCQSICMVALLVPEYLESSWCKAEWKAMEKLEQERLGGGQQGLIIPVIFRGDPKRLQAFFGTREAVDLRSVVDPSTQLRLISNRRKIEAIAAKISD